MNSKLSPGIIAGVIFLAFVWGSSFILMKAGRHDYDTWQMASLRLCFAGIFAVPIAIANIRKITLKDFGWMATAGFCGNGVPAFLFAYAGSRIPSSVSGSLNALTPLFTLIIGVYLFKSKISGKKIIGILVGLAGAMLLIFTRKQTATGLDNNIDILACLLIVGACILYGINVNIIRNKLSHLSALNASMFPLSIIAIPSLFIALYCHAFSITPGTAPLSFSLGGISFALTSIICVALLGIVGNSISLLIFNRIIKKTSAIFAASITYLVPFIAIFWGLLDHESISMLQVSGLGLILVGITLTR